MSETIDEATIKANREKLDSLSTEDICKSIIDACPDIYTIQRQIKNNIIDKINKSIADIDTVVDYFEHQKIVINPDLFQVNLQDVLESWNFLKRLAENKKKELENEES